MNSTRYLDYHKDTAYKCWSDNVNLSIGWFETLSEEHIFRQIRWEFWTDYILNRLS